MTWSHETPLRLRVSLEVILQSTSTSAVASRSMARHWRNNSLQPYAAWHHLFQHTTCVSISIELSGVIGSTSSFLSKPESCLSVQSRLWASLEALITSTQPVRQLYGRWRVIDAITHYSLCSFAVFSLLTWYIVDQIILSYSVTNMFILETYESTSQYGQATHYVML